MSDRKLPVDIRATMRLPRDAEKTLSLDLADLEWKKHGLEEIGPIDPAMLDLIEIARVVHEFDRRQPKRTTGARPKRINVRMTVRVPERWTAAARADLGALLRIQGNAEWEFDFRKRTRGKASADALVPVRPRAPKASAKAASAPLSAAKLEAVVLFSGGLDSTSGLATLMQRAERHLLVAYYTGNLAQQRRIAQALGFSRLVQVQGEWAHKETHGRSGGQYWYRSFLFLSLAMAVAHATGAASVLQFENGPLALAVPPLDIYRITRHAHPLVHRHLESLAKRLTGRAISITNPFLDRTKGAAVEEMREILPPRTFAEIAGETETCWYLNSRTIVAGQPRKRNGQPCGACVPCLVRRAALGSDDVEAAVDFKKRSDAARDQVVRVHYEAYSAFARRLLDRNYGLHDFLADAPAATRSAFNGRCPLDANAGFALYRRFAAEWTKAFS